MDRMKAWKVREHQQSVPLQEMERPGTEVLHGTDDLPPMPLSPITIEALLMQIVLS